MLWRARSPYRWGQRRLAEATGLSNATQLDGNRVRMVSQELWPKTPC